jgi:ribonuclease HI
MKSCLAYIDGGSRGNPGTAGYGVVLLDENNILLAEISEPLGIQTNNQAEYSALIGALRFATTHRYDSLRVFADSELLVRQIKGEYKVKNTNLKGLYEGAQLLIRQLKHFSIHHIPREQNRDADRLANLAMNKARVPKKQSRPSPKQVRAIFRSGCFQPLEPLDLPDGEEFQLTLEAVKE